MRWLLLVKICIKKYKSNYLRKFKFKHYEECSINY